MGMFDYYKPAPDLHCPTCKSVLIGWQGKDANCALFVWQPGIAFPIEQEAFDCNIDEEKRIKFHLPENFEIYTDCEKCTDCWITATCKTENGVWTESKFEKFPKLPRK